MISALAMTAALVCGPGQVDRRPQISAADGPRVTSPYYDNSPYEGSPSDGVITPAQYVPPRPSGGSDAEYRSPTIPSRQPTFVDDPPETWKPGWLKGGRATTFYVPSSGDDFGFAGLDLRTTFVAPIPLFSATPQINLLWADGPSSLTGDAVERPNGPSDVPGLLTGASVELRWFQPLSQTWVLDMAVSPGLYTDGENTGSDAFRLTGRALAYYKYSDAVRFGFGAVYLDREDLSVLPAAGLMLFPTEDTKIELIFPRPRIAHRIFNQAGVERWMYAAGEFGGGQWAVERADETQDTLQVRDYRFLLGLEQKDACGGGWLVEGGFVFGRELEYGSGVGDTELDMAAIVRAGITF